MKVLGVLSEFCFDLKLIRSLHVFQSLGARESQRGCSLRFQNGANGSSISLLWVNNLPK